MRQQRDALKDHPDMMRAQLAQFYGIQIRDIPAFDHDLAEARFDQTVEQAYQGRFAAARQAHDTEYLAASDLEAGVGNAHHTVKFLQDLLLRQSALRYGLDSRWGAITEDFPDRPAVNQHFFGFIH
jgi:hypothetical protein